jgi:uncharacterized SAM-binding protein YcdF (DUF218 family)
VSAAGAGSSARDRAAGSVPDRAGGANRCGPRDAERGGVFARLLVLLVFAAFLFGLYLFRVPLLQAAGHFWVVDDAPGPADAIVVLGDDNLRGDRATRAAELYRAHWAPHVVASGRPLRPYLSIPDLMRRDLMERGVPESAIVSYPRPVANTREEAEALRRLAVERGWRHVLVVTSSYHTRRSRFIFYRVWPRDYEFRVVAAHDADFDPDSWWRSRVGLKIVLHEAAGIAVAAWELRHAE